MRLRQLFEAPRTAVVAFGRMNPPTIGHQKLVDKIKSLPGDHYVFLSQSQKPKTDPLSFVDKLRYAKFFFPEVTIGNPEVRTIIQALQKINELGYENLIYVAGSDRVQTFEKIINDYNGKDYTFKSIKIVSAGERDPDAEGAEGMSASKLKKLAAEGKLEDWTDETGKKQPGFRSGVPKPEVADEMFAAVRQGMGVRDEEPVVAAEDNSSVGHNDLLTMPANTLVIDTPGELDWYKIGQHFPTMNKADPREFGQSESDMIMTFANEKEKQMFIKLAGKLGLKIKDVGGGTTHPEIHSEKAPPGREKQVKALKKEFPDDEGAPYAIAWAQHNKKKRN